MRRLFGLFGKVFTLPLKLGVWALLTTSAVFILGLFAPKIWDIGSGAIASAHSWMIGKTDVSVFDPRIVGRPDLELDTIAKVQGSLEPSLLRARSLIRQQLSEIAFIKEKLGYLENSADIIGANGTRRPGGLVLRELADALAKDQSGSKEERERFESLGGPTWQGLLRRVSDAESSMKSLLQTQSRVESLNTKLEERRRMTCRFIPEKCDQAVDKSSRPMATAEYEESIKLLNMAHEKLFRTLYAIEPSLVKDGATPEATNTASAH